MPPDLPDPPRYPSRPRLRDETGKPDPGYFSPGARKEKVRQRSFPRLVRRRAAYAELRTASAFSFLDGASLPEDLIERAAELEIPAVALVDRNGVYGTPRFYKAAREAGIQARVGAEVVVEGLYPPAAGRGTSPVASLRSPARHRRPETEDRRSTTGDRTSETANQPRLSLLVSSLRGYRNLCRLLTTAARGKPKGEAFARWEEIAASSEDLVCLTGGEESPLSQVLATGGIRAARPLLERLKALFPDRLYVELQRHDRPEEEHRNQALVELSRRYRLPLVATNGVRYARPRDKSLHDVLTCIREHETIDRAGTLLAAQRQRHLKSAEEMADRFADLPEALANTVELSQRLDFTLADLGYRFPDYPLPAGETPSSYLRQITWNHARTRFRPFTARAQRQLEKELDLIEKLDLAGYFLIVWDVVRFCQERGILVQGRGSAANSAVCYALSITAVDPVKMDLLFERFLSEERGEWPDIDLDLPSGDPREEVIQHVYRRYGPHGAAMTANVITYRNKSAAREVAKALGYSSQQVDALAKQLGSWSYDVSRGDSKELDGEIAEAGFDPGNHRMRLFVGFWQRIQNLPRHLGQHSGGMVLAAGRLDEVVPLEPAAMEGRVVVQWDKDDCADLGLIKVDLLGLGMLNVLAKAIPTIRTREKVDLDLAHLPPDDPTVYRMLRKADTVGVFQVESRAQMASLPRNAPRTFYDLVVQVAIIRPGPIVGGMVHPYFERRQGREEVAYPHPSLAPVLERTLGVPLFQEQILRMAMVTAGFSGGEAEELRRAMGFKRSVEKMQAIEDRLRRGMEARGITGETRDTIVQSITSFALYGFPESHAASFALIAYASAYLKAHHPTAFLIALLNAWPMGFYHPATLVKDAQLHGVEVLPIDVNRSGWECRWEERAGSRSSAAGRQPPAPSGDRGPETGVSRPLGAARLGLRFVKGLRQSVGRKIEEEQARRPFASVEDCVRRCGLRQAEVSRLAHLGVFGSLDLTRREALWQAAEAVREAGPLFERTEDPRSPVAGRRSPARKAALSNGSESPSPTGDRRPATGNRGSSSPLPPMSAFERTLADFAGSEMTVGPHPISYLRPRLDRWKVLPADCLSPLPDGSTVRIGGSVITRQRPGTARGLLFVTLEDETGTVQAAIMPDLFREHRNLLIRSSGLVIEGRLQKLDGSLSVKANRFWPLELTRVPSHDFR